MHARRARPPRFGLPFVEAPTAPAPTPAGMPACLSPGSQRTTATLHYKSIIAQMLGGAGGAVRQRGMGRV